MSRPLLDTRTAVRVGPSRLPWATFSRKWIAAGLAVLVLALAGVLFRETIFVPPAQQQAAEQVSLAILPFRNASGDQTLDWLGPSLAEMLRTDLGQSSHLRTVSSDRLHQILRDLRISQDSIFDPPTLRRLAEFSNAETVMWGQYVKFGDEIRIDATLQDLAREREIPLSALAANQGALLAAVADLAQSVRENLAFSPDIVAELEASAFQPSATSIQALRYYNDGLQLARQGQDLDAAKSFQASIDEDGEFALAYSKLAQTNSALGYDEDAARVSRQAVDLSATLPPQERYLILAVHAGILNDYPQAIESYENLVEASPNNTDFLFDLAGLYETTGALDLARDRYAELLARDPKYGDALLYFRFQPSFTFNRRRSAVPAIFEKLLLLPDGFAGDALEDDPSLASLVNGVTISRGHFKGPIFDPECIGWIGNPSVPAISRKFEKRYETAHTMELLAYIDINPMFPDEVWLADLTEFLDTTPKPLPFTRIWVFDVGHKKVKLRYEGADASQEGVLS